MRYLLKRESTTSTDASGYGAGLCSCHASCSPAKSRGSNASADAAPPAAPMNVRLFMPILRRSRKPSFPPLKKVRPSRVESILASADAALPAAPMNVRLFMPILRRSRKPSFPPLKKVRPSRVESILASVDGANGPRDQPVVAVLQLFEARIFLYSRYQAILNCAFAQERFCDRAPFLPAKDALRCQHQTQCEGRDHYFPDGPDGKRGSI